MFRGERCEAKGQPLALSSVKLKAPVPLPLRNIMCVGKNYHEHAKEFSASGFDSSFQCCPPSRLRKTPMSDAT